MPRQPADDEDHRHLRAQHGLRGHQNGDVAFGLAVIRGGGAQCHAPIRIREKAAAQAACIRDKAP